MPKQKAEKVTPPQDMDAHNAERDDTRSTAEVESDAAQAVAVLTTAEVAERLETTPRTLRKFLRSKGSGIEPVGQGKRYALTEHAVPKLATKFDAWKAKDAARRAAKADDDETANEAEAQVAEADDAVEIEELEELLEDDAPEGETTADELEAKTRKQLVEIAKAREIEVKAKATKTEIIALLMETELD